MAPSTLEVRSTNARASAPASSAISERRLKPGAERTHLPLIELSLLPLSVPTVWSRIAPCFGEICPVTIFFHTGVQATVDGGKTGFKRVCGHYSHERARPSALLGRCIWRMSDQQSYLG